MFCSRVKGLVLVLAAACAAGCSVPAYRTTQNFKVFDEDYGTLAEAALNLVERSGPVDTIIVADNIDPHARAQLKKLRKVVSAKDLPQNSDTVVPRGYFLLQNFSINDTEAMFEGELGPVTRSMTAIGVPDCGLSFSIPFYFESNDWRQPSYKILDCSQSRHWVPKED